MHDAELYDLSREDRRRLRRSGQVSARQMRRALKRHSHRQPPTSRKVEILKPARTIKIGWKRRSRNDVPSRPVVEAARTSKRLRRRMRNSAHDAGTFGGLG